MSTLLPPVFYFYSESQLYGRTLVLRPYVDSTSSWGRRPTEVEGSDVRSDHVITVRSDVRRKRDPGVTQRFLCPVTGVDDPCPGRFSVILLFRFFYIFFPLCNSLFSAPRSLVLFCSLSSSVHGSSRPPYFSHTMSDSLWNRHESPRPGPSRVGTLYVSPRSLFSVVVIHETFYGVYGRGVSPGCFSLSAHTPDITGVRRLYRNHSWMSHGPYRLTIFLFYDHICHYDSVLLLRSKV